MFGFQAREIQRVNFALTYIGPELHPHLLESMGAKASELCVDSHGFTHAFVSTFKQKRASNIEDVIASWNNDQELDATKVRFHPFPGEDNVVIFTKKPGYTLADHFIMKTIKEARLKHTAGEESSYRFWSSKDSFASHAQPTKKRRLERELEIDMVDATLAGGEEGCSSGSAAAAGPAFTPPPAPPADDGAGAGSALSAASAADGGRASPPLARILGYEVVDPNSPEIIRAKDEVIKSKDEAIAKCEELIRAKDEVINAKQFAIDALLRVLNRN